MSVQHPTGNKSPGKEREWRWMDQTNNQAIPQSWASNGRRESAEDGDETLYAIQFRFGLLLDWKKNGQTGELSGVPDRERAAVRVLYVTRDGSQAIVLEWDADRSDTGWVPEQEFHSVISRHAEDADDVRDDLAETYREQVEERYDVDEEGDA